MNIKILFFIGSSIIGFSGSVFASSSNTINFQGEVTDKHVI